MGIFTLNRGPLGCRIIEKMKSTYKRIFSMCFLILMASDHVHGGSFTSVTLTMQPSPTVMNNTAIHIDCNYEPTKATITTVIYTANTNNVYTYMDTPTLKNESDGVFTGRAHMASLVAGKFRLTVDPVTTKDDQIKMQCQVFGSSVVDSKISPQVTLGVNAIPQMLSLSTSPELPVAEKGTLTIYCSVNLGKPEGTVKWKKDVQGTVTELTGINVNDTDNGDNTKTRFEKYVITEAKAEENGAIYMCEVTNTAMTSEPTPTAKIKLNVHYSTRNLQISHKDDIVQTPEEIKCTADGNPAPDISWTKVSGEELTHTAGVLHVPASTYNGTYKYQCIAKNTVDGVETVFNETKEFSVFGHCEIVSIPETQYVTENSTASVMCKINGTERPIWLKEGAKLTFDCDSQDNRYSVSCMKQKYYNLTFTPDWSYRGKYSCGCHDQTKYVTVGVYVAPRSIRTSCKINAGEETEKNCIDTQISSGDNLTIATEISCAHPVPKIKWKVGDNDLDIVVFEPATLTTACTHGAFTGQTSVSQVFHATWKALGSPQTLSLMVVNEAKTFTVELKISETTLSTGEIAAVAAGVVVATAAIIGVIVITTKSKCAATATTKEPHSTCEQYKPEHKSANNKNMVDIIRKPYPEPVIEKPPPSPDEDSEKYEMSPLTNPE